MVVAVLVAFLSAGTSIGVAESVQSYFFDSDHTEVRFYWSHGGVSDQSAEFTSVKGDATFDRSNLSNSSVSISIDAKSATSGIAHLDGQFKSPYYFSVKEHPKITFVSTEIRQVSPKLALITGDLTLRGVTKPVILEAELRHDGEHPVGKSLPYYRGDWLGIHATTTLLRSDFGMDSHLPIISDRIAIEINAELKARKP
ncbi:MAG: YceI family protein [Pseudomonadota bacterium]